MDDKLKTEFENIPIPDGLHNRVLLGTEQAEKELKRQSRIKRFQYASGAAILGISLFIGSGMVSPVMAKMLSAIPFLSSLYGQGDIADFLYKGLTAKGFEVSSVSFESDNKKVSVLLSRTSSEKNLAHKAAVYAKSLLKNYHYSGYTVTAAFDTPPVPTKSKQPGEQEKVEKAIEDGLQAAGLAVTGVEADLPEKTLKIYSVKHYDSVKIRNHSKRILASINKKELKIKVFPGGDVHIRKVTNEEIVNEKILNALNSGLTQKKEWKVVKAEYVQNAQTIIIKTSLTAGRKQTKVAANDIARDVHEFISSEQFADKKLSYIIVDQKGRTLKKHSAGN